ncbi:MAG TPA: MCP four helix bundle domain-containing protein, partial [Chitinophaga sp.]
MRLKTKITLGVLFLYFMLLLVSVLGYYYLTNLNIKSRTILEDNYESLEYNKNMLASLDALSLDRTSALQRFEHNLEQQEGNITEAGEGPATEQVRKAFERLKQDTANPAKDLQAIRQSVYVIMDLNMQAIVGKNERV